MWFRQSLDYSAEVERRDVFADSFLVGLLLSAADKLGLVVVEKVGDVFSKWSRYRYWRWLKETN